MTPQETSVLERLRLDSDLILRRRFMVIDEPVKANIRVGLLLEELDKLAEETALRYVRLFYPTARVVTASMDNLDVLNAPDIEKEIVLRAQINYVGNTSMEVGVRIEQVGEVTVHLASCYFTMVARSVDGGEQSLRLPPLEYVSEDEIRRSRRAQESRSLRKRSGEPEYPTTSEYAMLHNLHLAVDRSARDLLLARDLVTSGWERTYPEHENVPQKIFGGFVAHRAYMYAHICAEMVADQRALLIASKRIDFYQPVRMGDKLHFVSRVAYTGKTSLVVETAITRVSRDRSMTALSNNCLFTFVNVDAELRLMPVPQMYPTTYSEDARYLAGYRQQLFHEQRKAGR
jgi:acyl-coenzyme A thioesterase 9